MQSHIFLCVPIFFSVLLHSTVISNKELKNKLAYADAIVFSSKDNLFDGTITNEDYTIWNNAIFSVKNFVEKKGKNDRDIKKVWEIIIAMNIELINTIKITNAIKNDKDIVKKQIEHFQKIILNLTNAQNTLNRAVFFIHKKKKIETKKVMSSLLIFMISTAIKAIDNAKFYTQLR